MDMIFFCIYALEVIVKIIAYGIDEYFQDSWNSFDFFLVIFQLLFDYILYNIISQTLVQSFKANRLLKLAKIQKVFRLFRAFRTIKVLSVCMVGVEVFNNVKDLFIKIIICIPVVIKQIMIIWIVYYIYAIISVELFSSIGFDQKNSPYSSTDCSGSRKSKKRSGSSSTQAIDWSACGYADFNTLWGAMLLLLQIFIGDLSTIVFDVTYKIDNLLLPSLFFGSFIFISIFLLALLGGLIWEVFTIVEDIWKQEREWENKQQEKLEREEQIKQLSPSKSNFSKRRKSMSLNQNISMVVDNKKPKIQQPNHNFVLDLLQDYDDEDIQFTDSDMFDLNDKSPYPFQEKSQQKFFPSIIKEEESYYLSDNIEEEKEMNIQESVAVKQIDLMDKYNLNDKQDNQTQQLSTMPFSTNNGDFQNKKQSLDNSQTPLDILISFFQQKFNSPKEFFQQNQNLQTEGSFESHHSAINNFYVNQIKDDLKSFEEMNKQETIKDINIQNHQFLIENAILKGANQKEIRKQELNHFFEKFGHQFEQLREMKMTALLSVQSRLLFHLHNSLKYTNLNLKFFFQMFLSIENLLSSKLLPGNSFLKFTFSDQDQNYYYLNYKENKFYVQFLSSMAWQAICNVKMDESIIIGNNFVNAEDMKNDTVKKELKQFFLQTKEVGQTIKSKFGNRSILSQEYYILQSQIENEWEEEIVKHLKEINQKFFEKYNNIEVKVVEHLQIWLFLEKNELQRHQIFKDENSKIEYKQYKNNLPEQSSLMNMISFHNEGQEDECKEEQNDGDYFKDEDQYPFLPFPYIYELLKDLMKVIELNPHNLFMQLTQMLHLRRSYNLVDEQ